VYAEWHLLLADAGVDVETRQERGEAEKSSVALSEKKMSGMNVMLRAQSPDGSLIDGYRSELSHLSPFIPDKKPTLPASTGREKRPRKASPDGSKRQSKSRVIE
jgi:hypothetical protein